MEDRWRYDTGRAVDVADEVRRAAREAAHPGRPGGRECRCRDRDSVLAGHGEAYVLRHGDAVAKAHAAGTGAGELAVRLAVAADPALRAVLLAPLGRPRPVGGRIVTVWPYGAPVDPRAPDDAPWEAAGTLLALLHRADPARLPGPLPPMRGPAKAARAVALLRAAGPHPMAAGVFAAWERLPAWARGLAPGPPSRVLCHGDLHLGQLVRPPAAGGGWRLIDVDDLGLGDPAWDLARPAAWHACGLLGPAEWHRFLGAYRAAGGPAVPAEGDPWPALDVPARALTVQTAARALAKALAAGRPPDEVECAVADACARIAALP